VTAAAATACSLLLLPVLVIGAATGGDQLAEPSATALADIPPRYLALYQEAATELGMPWELLAAVGKVESDHGRDPASRRPNSAGAEGPMQFLPATFAAYHTASSSEQPDVYDPRDAIYAAAALLVENGVRGDPRRALYAYNHAGWYVDEVLRWAAAYEEVAAPPADAAQAGPAATHAVAYALAQLGSPYRWGGDDPGGFDCSGLVQAAYASAGVELPRVAQQQYDATQQLPPGTPLQPGDLVFFGADTRQVSHVGIVLDDGRMVDAPHTGAVVRVESYRWSDYLGATRPTG
jgi:cell wall-associated NlpC family hydrolase